jgi:hypothetical protein
MYCSLRLNLTPIALFFATLDESWPWFSGLFCKIEKTINFDEIIQGV